ncbi:MAG TPA: SAM-dependent methyltransferase [Gammaproteobacteria bacterium]|nr:SAM-dependent methyltransferase [Gammaproteobacteria bacterium]
MIAADLPEPDVDTLAHSARVAEHIRAAIEAAGGAIPFSEYMRLALYAPGLGYYRAGTEKFGAAGDFVTAPEVSPLFGAVVGRQLAETLAACEGDTVLELGAGSGRLALDVLRTLAAQDRLPARYLILEVSGELAARQRQLLAGEPALAARVSWLDRLPETPVRGVIVANEIADALPVERFRFDDGNVVRLGVKVGKAGFEWAQLPASSELTHRVTKLAECHDWPEPYESECCPELAPWIAALGDSIECGVLLLFDYGFPEREYYHPQRDTGTLVCHYRHRAHEDPFLWPGLCDITAWVDFSSLAMAGRAAGLDVAGYTTQANFLLGGGIGDAVAAAANDVERYRIAGEIKRLALPSEMGESFKAIALTKDCPAPSAFNFRNLFARLQA